MPNISVEIPDVENSISRPVVAEVVRQLCEITGIDKNIKLMFPGDINESYQKGSDLSAQGEGKTKLPFTDQMQITVTENDYPGSMILTASHGIDQVPLFMDDKIQVSLRPIKSPVEVVLSLEYRASSKSEAEAWENRMKRKLHTYGEINLHSAQYNYIVPKFLMMLLENIHRNREAVRPYSQTYAEYLAGFSTSRATAITSLDGKGVDFAVTEEQIQIQGLYEFEVKPDRAENSGDGAAWTTSFTYKFMYDKTIGVNAKYPVMVHNQLLDNHFLIEDNAPNMDNHRKSYSRGAGALSKFESSNSVQDLINRNKPVHIPSFDEFNPVMSMHKTATLVTALFAVNEQDPRSIVSLRDLGDFQIDEDILNFMTDREWSHLSKPFQTLFLVSLYKDNKLMDDTQISVNENLEVRAYKDLDPRDRHQVRLAMYTDIDSVRIEALRRMKRHPKALVKILLAMGVSMGQLKLLAQRVNLMEFMKDYLPDTGFDMATINRNRRQTSTVMISYVTAGSYERDMAALRQTARK